MSRELSPTWEWKPVETERSRWEPKSQHQYVSTTPVELSRSLWISAKPYRGAGLAFNDLIPGRVDVMINFAASSLPLARQGQLRVLATPSADRLAIAPEVPTMAEAGVSGVEVWSWAGFFLRARTTMEIVGKIHTDTVAALADPAIRTKLEQGGAVVSGSTPAELAAFLHSEMEKWGAVIKEANIKAQ